MLPVCEQFNAIVMFCSQLSYVDNFVHKNCTECFLVKLGIVHVFELYITYILIQYNLLCTFLYHEHCSVKYILLYVQCTYIKLHGFLTILQYNMYIIVFSLLLLIEKKLELFYLKYPAFFNVFFFLIRLLLKNSASNFNIFCMRDLQ